MNPHIETQKEFVVRKLREAMPKSWPAISAATGVPEKTIYKVAYGETKDPRSSTLEPLYRFFVGQLIESDKRQQADRRSGSDRRHDRRKGPRRSDEIESI